MVAERRNDMMDKTIPMVRATILGPAVRALKDAGIDPGPVLEPFHLTELSASDPTKFIHHIDVYDIFEAIAVATGRADFCASVGESVNLVDFLPFGKILAEASTIGDFFTRFIQAVSKDTNAVSQQLIVEDEHAYFSAKRKFSLARPPAQADGFMIGIWASFLHRMLEFRWDPSQIIVRMCDPDVLPTQFHGITAIKSNWHGFSIRFPSAWLSLELDIDKTVVDTALPPDELDLQKPGGFIEIVETLLAGHIGEANFGVAEAARLCGSSKSVLSRKLARHGFTIIGVISKLKMQAATAMLSSSDASISQIAMSVGYSDPTAFTRAFKGWTGMTPTDYRAIKKRQIFSA
jgi:AraC-like DNA-binding protein